MIFKFNFCKICTSCCEFKIYRLFLKNLLLFKNMVVVILFHVCDSYFITSTLHPAIYQGAVFDTQCFELAKTSYLFLVVLFSQLNKLIVSCADWYVYSLVQTCCFVWTSMLFVRFCYSGIWVVVNSAVHWVKSFLIVEVVRLFFRNVPHSNDSRRCC